MGFFCKTRKVDSDRAKLIARTIFAILITGDVASAAGFNCQGTLQQDEKIVCSDATLSRLDDDLNAAYKSALAASSDAADRQRSDQRTFLVRRHACSADAGCIRSLYSARITELKEVTGTQIFEPEKQAQDSTLVDQAQKLLSLALKCPSKPIQEGSALFYKYEYESIGDSTVLRIKEILHSFEGFKFPGQQPAKSDMPIPGVNAATETTSQTTYSAGLNSIADIQASKQGELTVRCAGGNKCVRIESLSGQASCKAWNGASCNYGSTSNQTEQRVEVTFEGICQSQVKNAGDALSILISAAKYGQTK